MFNRVSLYRDDGRPSTQASRVFREVIGWRVDLDILCLWCFSLEGVYYPPHHLYPEFGSSGGQKSEGTTLLPIPGESADSPEVKAPSLPHSTGGIIDSNRDGELGSLQGRGAVIRPITEFAEEAKTSVPPNPGHTLSAR